MRRSFALSLLSGVASSAGNALWGRESPVEIIILTDRVEPTTALLDSVCVNTERFLSFHVVVPDRSEDLAATILPESCEGSTLRIYTETGIVASIRELDLPATWEIDVPYTPHTVQVAPWDHNAKHNSVFNSLRFYLALLPEFSHLEQIIFMDDDVVMRGDIAKLWDHEQTLSISAGCLNWIWNDCGRFEASLDFSYLDVPYFGFGSMTGDRSDIANVTCKTTEDVECAPPGFFETLAEASAEIKGREGQSVLTIDELRSKQAWNFGLNKFNLTAWRQSDLTETYFKWINANAHYGWFPTTSLAYGLGIPFLVLADDMVCIDDDLPILHGLGFVEADDLLRSPEVANRGIDTYYALHWNGDRKPWLWEEAIDEYAQYFLAHSPSIKEEYIAKRKQVALDADIRRKAKTNSFLVWTAPRSGSEWFMSILDRHPTICASGETQSPGRGWPREALLPREATEWTDVCQPKAVCHWSITERLLKSLLQETEEGQHLPEICYATQAEAANYSYYGSHLGTICALLNRAIVVAAAESGSNNVPSGSEKPENWHQRVMQAAFHNFVAHVLGGEKPGDEYFEQLNADAGDENSNAGLLNPDDRLFHASFAQEVRLPCACPLHTTVTGLKVMGGWLQPPKQLAGKVQEEQHALDGYNLTGIISTLGSKLIILDRMNLVSSYISLRIGQSLGTFHCSGKNCQHDHKVNVQLDRLIQFLKQTIAQRIARNALLESMNVDILHVEYELCVAAPRDCFDRVLSFLDVDGGDDVLDNLLSTTEGASFTRDARYMRDRVFNFDSVATGLNKAGFGHFLSMENTDSENTKRSDTVGGYEIEQQMEELNVPKTHVALLSDRAYAIAATLTSVCIHASDVSAIAFHLVLPNDATDPAWDVKDVLDSCAGASFDLRSMASVEAEVKEKIAGHDGAVWTDWEESDEKSPAKVLNYAEDRDAKHVSPFNLARFYLPLLSAFDKVERVLLLDDDVIVQGDILDADATALYESRAAVVAGCQNWAVDTKQEVDSETGKITTVEDLSSSVLMNIFETTYLGFNGVPRGAPYTAAFCRDETSKHCMPQDFLEKLASARDEVSCKLGQCTKTEPDELGALLQTEPAWNWGLASINVPQWRSTNISLAYHEYVEATESRNLFPRGSLSHGLGIGIVALQGRVQCWESVFARHNEGDISVLQGLGFLTPKTLEKAGIDTDTVFALHFNGETKPWTDKSPYKAKWDEYSSASYLDNSEVMMEDTTDSSFLRRKLVDKKLRATRKMESESRRLGQKYGYESKSGEDLYVKNLYVKNMYVEDGSGGSYHKKSGKKNYKKKGNKSGKGTKSPTATLAPTSVIPDDIPTPSPTPKVTPDVAVNVPTPEFPDPFPMPSPTPLPSQAPSPFIIQPTPTPYLPVPTPNTIPGEQQSVPSASSVPAPMPTPITATDPIRELN